jgi:hypothetical protein
LRPDSVWVRKRTPRAFELLKIRNGLPGARSAEPIEPSEDENIELAIFGRPEHLIESLPLPPPLSDGLVADDLAGEVVAVLLEKPLH